MMLEMKSAPASIPAHKQDSSKAMARTNNVLLALAGVLIPLLLACGFAIGDATKVLAIILGLLGLLLIVAQPFVGLILFIILLYTRPEETIPALAGMHFTLMVAVVTLAGMVVQMLMDKTPLVRTPMNRMIVCFGLATVLSTVPNGESFTAVQDIGRLVLLVLLILNLTRTQQRYDALVTALLVVTSYLALYSIYLVQTGNFVIQDGELRSKATGIFSDPNDLAATFVPGIALGIMRVMQTRGLFRVSWFSLLGIMLYATVVTNSRGGFLALVAVAIGYLLVAKIPKPTKIGLAIVGALLLLSVSAGRMTNFNTHEASANSRFWFWSNGCNMLMSHPLLGVGYGQFMSQNGGMTAHNSFVLCFGELGFVGYFFWLAAIYYCFKPKTEQMTDPLIPACVGQNLIAARMGLTGYLVASFWLSHTYSPILYVFLALPMAAQMAAGAIMQPAPTRRRTFSWQDLVCICGLMGLSISFIWFLAEHNK